MACRSRLLLAVACTALPVACSSGSGLPAVDGPTAPKLELGATEMRYSPSRIAVAAGQVPVVLRNEGLVVHDLRIEDKPSLLVEAAPGKIATATWSCRRAGTRSTAPCRATALPGWKGFSRSAEAGRRPRRGWCRS